MLLKIRQHFAYGRPVIGFAQRNCMGWVCPGDKEHPDGCAVVVSNGQAKKSVQSTFLLRAFGLTTGF